jgi:hypothetical protein
MIERSMSSFSVKVEASINHLCNELKLSPLVRTKCIEMSNEVKPKQEIDVSDPVANSVACAIISIVHEDAWRKHRVPQHLPDRMIGQVYGMNSAAVVYNKHLLSKVMSRAA